MMTPTMSSEREMSNSLAMSVAKALRRADEFELMSCFMMASAWERLHMMPVVPVGVVVVVVPLATTVGETVSLVVLIKEA